MDKYLSRTLSLVMGLVALLLITDAGRPLLYDLSNEIILGLRSIGIPIYTFDALWTCLAILFFLGATVRVWHWKDRNNKWKESQRRRARLFSRDPADDVPIHTGKRRADPDPPLRL